MAEYAQSGHTVLSKRRLTVCVVGSGGVGKSSLTIRYLQGHFPEVSGRRLDDFGIIVVSMYVNVRIS